MKRQEILDTAKQVVTKDRAATHGDAESSFTEIGKIWAIRLGVTISPEQVAIMLTDLKTVRAWHNPTHADNWVDLAGYAACGGEIATVAPMAIPPATVGDATVGDVGALKSVTVDVGERVEITAKWGRFSWLNRTNEPHDYTLPDGTTPYRVVPA